MSGYFGMVRLDGSPVDQRFLAGIGEELAFRGPDGQNIWTQDSVGGCFALMRTGPASQAVQQPVIHNNRFLWGDIRLDAQRDLLAQLSTEASAAPELTSEDLLLMAWSKWGANALERIIGDFSFALWDASKQRLHCARDFVGPRPFYYSHIGDVFYFSNTLRILRLIPEISRELDETFIGDFLLEGWSLEPSRTVYRGIRRLPPGHALSFSNGQLEVRRFRKLPIEEPLRFARPEEYVAEYRELLNMAVSDRLPSGCASLYLSGGLDSTTVCATAAGIAAADDRKNMLKAFTFSWESTPDDPEPHFASITAQYLGIAHEIIREPDHPLFEAAQTGVETSPEPDEDFFFVQQQRQLRTIAAHSNVVLSGDGGDNVLTGQSWPYLVQLIRQRNLSAIAREFGGYLWTHRRIPPIRGGFRTKIRLLLKGNNPFKEYPAWLNSDFEARNNLRQRWLDLSSHRNTAEHPLHPEGYRSLHDDFWGSTLERHDTGWNRVRLESRAPLLDLRILTFLLRLPPVPWCMHKELARQAMRNLLPEPVLQRPKTPLLFNELEVCGDDGQWFSRLSSVGPGRAGSFVNWQKWCETSSLPKGSLNWMNLRPACLFFWLKAVESM